MIISGPFYSTHEVKLTIGDLPDFEGVEESDAIEIEVESIKRIITGKEYIAIKQHQNKEGK